MGNTILLLSNSQKHISKIETAIRWESADLMVVEKNDLMKNMYSFQAKMLLVDLDSFGLQTLSMIQSILNVEYLPVIYFFESEEGYSNSLLVSDNITVPISKLECGISEMVEQGTGFKNRYNIIMESYDAIDLMNSSMKALIDKYLLREDVYDIGLIRELLNAVFSGNRFISNYPANIYVIFEEIKTAVEFEVRSDGFVYEKNTEKLNDLYGFGFDTRAENGFHKNFGVLEYSDIESGVKLFPDFIYRDMDRINNFSGYSIGDLIFIGFNYPNTVTHFDSAVMKAIAINVDLIEGVKRNMRRVEESFIYTMNALARAAEVNDDSTGYHIKRVNFFSRKLSEELGMGNKFTKEIFHSAQMHDVGKIYVEKAILTKPGKLTEQEFENMKMHTLYGEKIIGNSSHLKMASEIAANHHEKYDGSGYPQGRKGTEIPLSARIVALADIYDALRSPRCYKPAFTHEKTLDIIINGDGRVEPSHFDPNILEAFKRVHNEFKRLYDIFQ